MEPMLISRSMLSDAFFSSACTSCCKIQHHPPGLKAMASFYFIVMLVLSIFKMQAASAQNSSAELAIADTIGTFIGASASLNVWQPYVEMPNEYSASQITLVSPNNTDIIEVGWHVYPMLYEDNDTHLFVRWTIVQEGGRIGCFNTACRGFVQTSTNIIAGDSFYDDVSEFNGRQFSTTIYVLQSKYGDWWVSDDTEKIGYFPADLLGDLRFGASIISWGGKVLNKLNDSRHTYTEMGSGSFPLAGYGYAAYQSDLSYTEENNVTTKLIGEETLALNFENVGNCYYTYFEEPTGRLYFGGAGNNPRCQTSSR